MTGRKWDGFALAIRAVMAVVWLHNGLWLKLIAVDAHHQKIVASTFHDPVLGNRIMMGIGLCETLLAVGILCSGQIERPAALVVSNLPLVACALAIILFGPGRWALSFGKAQP